MKRRTRRLNNFLTSFKKISTLLIKDTHCPPKKIKGKFTFKIQLLKADEGIMWTAWLAGSVWKNNSGEKKKKKRKLKMSEMVMRYRRQCYCLFRIKKGHRD